MLNLNDKILGLQWSIMLGLMTTPSRPLNRNQDEENDKNISK